MRYLFGIIITALLILTTLFFSLKIWHIDLLDAKYLKDIWIIFSISFISAIVLTLLLPFFFRPHSAGYDKKGGNVVQPKK